MFKHIKNKLKTEWNKKSDPDAPVVTQRGIEIFILRLLLSVLVYAVIYNYVIPGLEWWRFLIVDGLIMITEGFIAILNKK